MKRAILSAVILTASAGLALSAEVAPDDLTFTDGGAVEQSLTGGSPAMRLRVVLRCPAKASAIASPAM